MPRVKNTRSMSVALSFQEIADIDAAAEAAGMTRNAWIRASLAEAARDEKH